MIRTFALAAGVIFIAGGVSLIFFNTRPAARGAVPLWSERIEENTEAAIAMYLAEGNALSYDESHALAHIFGEALYLVRGIEGIRHCTDDFSYGCYHAVSGEAFAEAGPDATESIKAACAGSSSPFTCIHGAGHGVLSYVGESNIAEAFELCAPFHEHGSTVGGCFGGVMMEYNFRTMSSDDGIDVRPLVGGALAGPCDALPATHREACVYELPPWWWANLATDEATAAWETIGQWCLQLPDDVHRACYRGTGNLVAPHAGFDISEIENACAYLPADGQRHCVEESLGHLLASEAGKTQLRTYCASADALRSFCEKHVSAL